MDVLDRLFFHTVYQRPLTSPTAGLEIRGIRERGVLRWDEPQAEVRNLGEA